MIPKPKSTSGDSSAPSPRPTRHLPEPDSAEDAKRKPRAVKLFEVNAKPADGLPAMPRRPQRSWRLWGLALLAAGCGAVLIARAQQPNTPDQTPDQTTQPMTTQDDASQSNTPMESDDQSNSPVEVEVFVNSNSPSAEFFSTNSSGRRFRRSYRRRSGAGNANQAYNEPSPTGGTNANGRADLSVFSVITRNNIFDPNRHRGYSPIVRTREPATQYFALRGTASLGNDTFAVFDGTRSDYHKDVRVADTIADYKIVEITPDAVKLASGTNQVELRVGMQMRREDQGPWTRSEASQGFASTSATASSASGSTNIDPPISGPESDVLKRLMKQREQE